MADSNKEQFKKEYRSYCLKVALQAAAYTAALAGAHWVWSKRVNETVPEPYLLTEILPKDEVFHAEQAQRYCERDLTWDPKITTPPGLYVLSLAYHSIPRLACSTSLLRSINGLLLITAVFINAFMCRDAITSRQYPLVETNDHERRRRLQRLSADLHTALNIALFPPLFFFSALYYTDVASTAFTFAFINLYFRRSRVTSAEIYIAILVNAFVEAFVTRGNGVLATLVIFAVGQLGPAVNTPDPGTSTSNSSKNSPKSSGLSDSGWPDLILVGYGVLALCLRQTNVFWVTVFPAGLSLASHLQVQKEGNGDSLLEVLGSSWKDQTIYDPMAGNASAFDYVMVPLSIVVAWASILCSSRRGIGERVSLLTGRLGAYVIILALFAVFVLWNGAIVLGDKSNHVATLHLPQILYIWPLIAFFSLPLLLPPVIGAVLPKRSLSSSLKPFANSAFPKSAPQWAAGAGILAIMLASIDRNTIIHPFTLADNRHYIFYVFRILLKHPALKYLAAPVYFACMWAVLQSLGVPSAKTKEVAKTGTRANSAQYNVEKMDPSNAQQRVSTAAVWLVTSTLCLVTTPLVEPRYFILPWIIWRLMVPGHQEVDLSTVSDSTGNSQKLQAPSASDRSPETSLEKSLGKSDSNPQRTVRQAQPVGRRPGGMLDDVFPRHGDYRLRFETLWFIIINAVTGYVFLYKGFEWPQEPGNVQRFMW